ncbi:hypothetical protein B7P43_G03553 [Cryptotermes secundus]|uniref:Zinc finger PHD-type domain-containing protein n=1 Tax=Cryptotermes secundus TaxID=105785 RepID=A0A2J7R542_9NEOP|nr:hypothetical protein B7P43_G03553 [Cryptotermes secundus]
MRREPRNNKQGSKTLCCDGPSVVSTCSAAIEEEKINCPGCEEAYEEPITEDWVQCGACKQWWHEDCSGYKGFRPFKCDVC